MFHLRERRNIHCTFSGYEFTRSRTKRMRPGEDLEDRDDHSDDDDRQSFSTNKFCMRDFMRVAWAGKNVFALKGASVVDYPAECTFVMRESGQVVCHVVKFKQFKHTFSSA